MRRGIAFRLSLLICIGGGFAVAIVLGYNYLLSRRLIVTEIEEGARNLALARANHVEAVLRSTQKVPEYIADLLQRSDYNQDEILTLIRTAVEQNPEIYGSTIAFEPYGFDDGSRYFAPYYYRPEPGKVELTWLGSDSYRYFTMDWYQIPKELGHAIWSEPYYDEGGGEILMSTSSVPFYRTSDGQRRFMGVVTADVSLNWLHGFLSSVRLSESGYAFLISRDGRIITHPHRRFVMNETIFTLAEARDDPQLRTIGRAMIRGNLGVAETVSLVGEQVSWLVYAPVPASGWSLAAVFPRDEVLADVVNLTRLQVALALAGGLLSLGVVIAVARSITRPLTALALATEEVARGNLDSVLPVVRSRDEVARLTQAFGQMQRDLKQYLEEHDQLLAIRHELDVARRIQESILPRTFPPFPERTDFEIFATMHAAREVGGDFYDLFLVDGERLGFAIGDVSGKGVPAALFMAVTRTLLRSTALQGLDAGACLQQVNSLLCIENSADMFVTLFYGILHPASGMLEYGNGGHPAPYVLRRDGGVEPLEGTGALVLGIMEGVRYETRRLTLGAGEGLLVYTDGVTEAMDATGALFSDRCLQELLGRVNGASPERIVEAVVAAVRAHAADAAQSDDITVLALRLPPP